MILIDLGIPITKIELSILVRDPPTSCNVFFTSSLDKKLKISGIISRKFCSLQDSPRELAFQPLEQVEVGDGQIR
jgi:hypothetical protein